MCGILGILPPTPPHRLQKALQSLAHRGPDHAGVWSDREYISLGHRRLSILDLTADGHQPMVSGNGRYVLVFNGEIYNFVEIKDELSKKGYTFKSRSDSEVLLAAYEAWNAACLNKLNGMWAFAIWDQLEKSLFLARDRFGKKPLFYAQNKERFIFASEMKAICYFLPLVRPSRDFWWMSKNLFRYESTDKCLIEGIKRFPAGHWGLFKNSQLNVYRYWNTLDHLVQVPHNYNDQVGHFRELFVDACRIRMRSDVPIGTALSGGLDSSATLSTMAHVAETRKIERVSNDWHHAFVAAFPGTPLDESHYAQKVVDHLGIKASFIAIDPLKHIDRLNDYLFKFEELYITSPIPMVETYAAIKQHGVSVTLDGHGADELFSGYGNSLLLALFDAGPDLGSIKQIFNAHFGLSVQNSVQFKNNQSIIYQYLRFMAICLAKDILKRNYVSVDSNHSNFNKLDNLTRHLYTLTTETILPTLLRNYDRYSMSNGVEIRMPFMDHRIITFIMSLPWTSKIRNGYTKSLVRDAMQSFLPEDIVWRKNKIGFNSPIVDWMKGPLKSFFMDIINSVSFRTCDLLDSQKTAAKIERVIHDPAATFEDGEKAWSMLAPYLWEQSMIKRPWT